MDFINPKETILDKLQGQRLHEFSQNDNSHEIEQDGGDGSLLECQDCEAHYQTTPSGEMQSGGCPSCGGDNIRPYRNQPSPTIPDGSLENTLSLPAAGEATSDNPTRGNPLAEGTIMGSDGERPLGKRDNYTHGHVSILAALPFDQEDGGFAYNQQNPGNKMQPQDVSNPMAPHINEENKWVIPCADCDETGNTPDGTPCPSCRGEGARYYEGPPDEVGGYGTEGWEDPSKIIPARGTGNPMDNQLNDKIRNEEIRPAYGSWTHEADFKPGKDEQLYSDSRYLGDDPYMPWTHNAGLLGDIGGIAGLALAPMTDGLSIPMGSLLGKLGGDGVESVTKGLMGGAMGGGQQAPQGGAGGFEGGAEGTLAKVAYEEYETPSSNPEVGTFPNDPEKVDQKEFNDQDKNPQNAMNPNLQDSGASGEDAHQGENGYGHTPGMERLEMNLPTVLHYFNSPENGHDDPTLQAVHEILEKEKPGYLDSVTPEDEALAREFALSQGQRAAKVAIYNMDPNKMTEQMGAAQSGPQTTGNQFQPIGTPTAMGEQAAPMSAPTGPASPPAGNCIHGNNQAACPLCQAQAAAPTMAPQQGFAPAASVLSSLVEAADHQGPVDPEQMSAVITLLIAEGRIDEAPMVPTEPSRFAPEMDKIQPNVESMPKVEGPEQAQPAPPAPPGGAPGSQPGPSAGEPGGQPMQPHASVEAAADNVAPDCPKCGSGTTGMLMDEDNHAECKACHNVFKVPNAVEDKSYNKASKVALVGQPELNPVAAPAAERKQAYNPEADKDGSMTWVDSSGQKLIPGREYEMINPTYSLPDVVRVDQVKPDAINVTLVGEYQNEDALQAPTEISKQEAQMDHIDFKPLGHGHEEGQVAGTPGAEHLPEGQPTTDEHENSFPPIQPQSSVRRDICPNCKEREITSRWLDPETTEYECFKCGHTWDFKEATENNPAGIDLSWLNESSNEGESERYQQMMEIASSNAPRDLSAIAEKDVVLQHVKDVLDENIKEGSFSARMAGKKFSPSEEQDLIDEDGEARNRGLLDLSNTHYESSMYSNSENVDDTHFALGF